MDTDNKKQKLKKTKAAKTRLLQSVQEIHNKAVTITISHIKNEEAWKLKERKQKWDAFETGDLWN